MSNVEKVNHLARVGFGGLLVAAHVANIVAPQHVSLLAVMMLLTFWVSVKVAREAVDSLEALLSRHREDDN